MEKMNKKGFSLVELLAVVAILGIVGGIATVSVLSYINTSKEKSEKIFVEQIANLIDDYLDLNKPTVTVGTSYFFEKCANSNCSSTTSQEAKKVQKEEGPIYLKDLVTKKIIEQDKLVNPKNKKNCLESGNGPEIKIYKDKDFVYYYYVDLREGNTTCDISKENGIINTLPDSLKNEVGLS